jgi:hypothetical protein
VLGRFENLPLVELEAEAAGTALEIGSGNVHGAGVAAREGVMVDICDGTDSLDSRSGKTLEMGSGKVHGAGFAAREGNVMEDVEDETDFVGSSEGMLAGMTGTISTAGDEATRAGTARFKFERIFGTAVSM